jgi:hypothetical protein
MQALAVEKLTEGDWLYEVKLDGYRALGFKDGKDVRLISRNNKPLIYPQLLADHVILVARSSRSTRRADLLSNCFKSTKAPSNVCRLFTTSSTFFFWKAKTCAMNRSRPGVSYSPRAQESP